MTKETVDAPSGVALVISDDAGGVCLRELSIRELGEIGNGIAIPPELYLDVEAELLGEEIDETTASKIQQLLTVASEQENWGLDAAMKNDRLAMMAAAIMLRVGAANRLSLEPWMDGLLRDAMRHGNMLLRLAHHYTSAPLQWSEEDGQFIFDAEAARKALHELPEDLPEI